MMLCHLVHTTEFTSIYSLNMPSLTVTLDGNVLATVCCDGFDVVTARVSGTRITVNQPISYGSTNFHYSQASAWASRCYKMAPQAIQAKPLMSSSRMKIRQLRRVISNRPMKCSKNFVDSRIFEIATPSNITQPSEPHMPVAPQQRSMASDSRCSGIHIAQNESASR